MGRMFLNLFRILTTDTDKSDIVKQSRIIDLVALLFIKSRASGEHLRVVRDSYRVTSRLIVCRIYSTRDSLDDLLEGVVDLLDFLIGVINLLMRLFIESLVHLVDDEYIKHDRHSGRRDIDKGKTVELKLNERRREGHNIEHQQRQTYLAAELSVILDDKRQVQKEYRHRYRVRDRIQRSPAVHIIRVERIVHSRELRDDDKKPADTYKTFGNLQPVRSLDLERIREQIRYIDIYRVQEI